MDINIVEALEKAAAEHGRSAEEEHLEILRSALSKPQRKSLKEILISMPNVGQDSDFECRAK